MPSYSVGDIVVVPFPFSGDPGTLKRRPAVVLATWSINTGRSTAQDYLLALITSQATGDPYRVPLLASDVIGRPLTAAQSFLRPTYLFAADEGLIAYKMATLAPATLDKALLVLHQLFTPVLEVVCHVPPQIQVITGPAGIALTAAEFHHVGQGLP